MSRVAAAPAAAWKRLGLICGAGDFPREVAAAAVAAGREVLLIGLKGSADRSIETFPHVWVHVGEVGKMFRALEAFGTRDLVLVGAVRRPAVKDVRLDWVGMKSVGQLSRLLGGGDDQVLAGLIGFLERQGYAVLGVQDVAPSLLVAAGVLGHVAPDADAHADIAEARRLLGALGPFDVGQSVVIAERRVLAVEAAEGTDLMLKRVAELRAQRRLRGEGGCLVKMAKPGQDLRVDLPAIGPRTVEGVREAKLAGIAVEAGRVIATDFGTLADAADRANVFLFGFDGRPHPP